MAPFTLAADSYLRLPRAIFRLTGPDAITYLNGQISQDIRLATHSESTYCVIANFKGKMDGDAYVRLAGDSVIVDAAPSLRESLFARLDRYIIADDATIEDVSDAFQLYHILSPTNPPADAYHCSRYGQDGYDLLLPIGITPSISGTEITLDDVEKVRITHRIPSWDHELDHDTLPPEAGLEARAISYTKGCYTGQEVISRMRSSGKTNRHLVLLQLTEPVPCFTPLLCEGSSAEKPAGMITSVCCIGSSHIALAFRHRKFQEQTTFSASHTTAHIL